MSFTFCYLRILLLVLREHYLMILQIDVVGILWHVISFLKNILALSEFVKVFETQESK